MFTIGRLCNYRIGPYLYTFYQAFAVTHVSRFYKQAMISQLLTAQKKK